MRRTLSGIRNLRVLEPFAFASTYERAPSQLDSTRRFSGTSNVGDCYLSVITGAGGDDAEEWSCTLLRMYKVKITVYV